MKYNCNNRERPERTTSYTYVNIKPGVTITRSDDSVFETKPKMNTSTITTKWNDIACGHITSNKDESCNGCKWCVIK